MSSRRTRARNKPLIASASVLSPDNTRHLKIQSLVWQEEAWGFFRSIGELNYALDKWFGNAMSRVRLIAAQKRVGADPLHVTEGPVAQLVDALSATTGGESQLMKRLAVLLSVPGESYLVGEEQDIPSGEGFRTWTVYSTSELKIAGRRTYAVPDGSTREAVLYQVQYAEGAWRPLAEESLVVRIWNPDQQYQWLPTSSCQAALPILREIDYYNRYIISTVVSRLAMNGILFIPSEAILPQRDEYKDAADPFVEWFLASAKRSIAEPGTASASVPMVLRVPAEIIEKFKHLTFDSPVGKEIVENREAALRRLATTLNIPGEVLTGMDGMNHWGQWQLEESAVKIHFAPMAEIICSALTRGYLWPMMRAAGIDNPMEDPYVVWYDASPITQTPDRSKPSQDIYGLGELSGDVLRASNGFDSDDAPSIDEIRDISLKRIALAAGADALWALAQLTGDESLVPPMSSPATMPQTGDDTDATEPGSDSQSAPDTRPEEAPSEAPA